MSAGLVFFWIFFSLCVLRFSRNPCLRYVWTLRQVGETKLKSPFSLHDDISKIGTRPEVNQSAFQRGKFDASKDRLLVNRKSLCSEL